MTEHMYFLLAGAAAIFISFALYTLGSTFLMLKENYRATLLFMLGGSAFLIVGILIWLVVDIKYLLA